MLERCGHNFGLIPVGKIFQLRINDPLFSVRQYLIEM